MQTNFLVVGFGSAGQRHVRILRKLFPKSTVHVYRGRHRRGLISPNLSQEDLNIDPITYYEATEVKKLTDFNRELNLLVIATPIGDHLEYIDNLWVQSERILVEKPISPRFYESLEIYKRAKSSNKPLLVGYQHYFNPIYKRILRLIQELKLDISDFEFWFQEPLIDMNPFRDMSTHHLAKEGQGSALLALSHELDFVLRVLKQFHFDLNVKSIKSVTWPKVADTVLIEGLGKHNGHKTLSINGVMSYANTNKRRGGSFSHHKNQISWDLFEKVVVVDGKVDNYDFTSEELFELQAKDFLTREEFDLNLEERIHRALQITYLHDRGYLSSSYPLMDMDMY